MCVIDGYQEAADQNHNVLKSKQSRGMNYPCPMEGCILTFSSFETMQQHLDQEEHVKEAEFAVQSTSDRVKKAWVAGLEGKVVLRKSGLLCSYFILSNYLYFTSVIREKLEGEKINRFPASSSLVPTEGWALFQRVAPGRLEARARDFLVSLFEDGKADRNLRCSPSSAEIKLRDMFPNDENCWLSVKQVVQL